MKINKLIECGKSEWTHNWRINDDSLSACKSWKSELNDLVWAEVSKISDGEYNVEISVNTKTIINTTELFKSNALGKVCKFIDDNIIDIINGQIK